ncbi:MAG: hypothetical protein IT236_00600 [Bacteroidia bacterium]|nr:hypothetical protein [Bacteroidia bacterium]
MELIKNIFYHYGFGLANACVALLLIYFGIKSKRKNLKIFLFNFSAVFIALFAFETFDYVRSLFNYTTNSPVGAKYSGTFFNNLALTGPKKGLGYGPRNDTSFCATAQRFNKEELIYDVTYCFEKGHRQTPNSKASAKKKVWFLGCSFTFGDGLNDTETLPYYFNEYSGGSFNVTNLGFSGYGTHQALQSTELNILNSEYNKGDTGIVVYSFIPEHFIRAAGKSSWDINGPWYELENGQLVYKGGFEARNYFKENYISKRLKSVWHSSFLYRSFFTPKASAVDVARVIEILKTMNFKLQQKGIKFYLVVTPEKQKEELYNTFTKELAQTKIPVFYADSILPNLYAPSNNYFIAGDGHPNKNYNIKIANYLAESIFKSEQVQ